jgi:hypothetical protein
MPTATVRTVPQIAGGGGAAAANAREAIGLMASMKLPTFAIRASSTLALNLMVKLTIGGHELEEPPIKDASFRVIGMWSAKQRLMMGKLTTEAPELELLLGPALPASGATINNMITGDPGFSPLVIDMVKDWDTRGGAYADNRVASATLQMANDGYNATEIAAVTSDPVKLRKYIQEKRHEYMSQIEEATNRIEAADPLDPATLDDRKLVANTAHWVNKTDIDEDNANPNDAAVDYLLHLKEVVEICFKLGTCSHADLVSRVEGFLQVVVSNGLRQSASATWVALQSAVPFEVNGIDISPALRLYTQDIRRGGMNSDGKANEITTPSHLRMILRVSRLAASLVVMPNVFGIMNSEPPLAAAQLVALRTKEQHLTALIKETRNFKKTTVEVSLAWAMTWLFIAGRSSLYVSVTGRNDLSVPKIVAAATGMEESGLQDLEPRWWSLWRPVATTHANIDAFIAKLDVELAGVETVSRNSI